MPKMAFICFLFMPVHIIRKKKKININGVNRLDNFIS